MTPLPSGAIHSPALSSDGSILWFLADPGALAGGPGLRWFDTASLAVHLAVPGTIHNYAVDATGTMVAVELAEDHPELGDSNGFPDIYVYNSNSGELALASRRMAAPESGKYGAAGPWISENGEWTLFESISEDIAETDRNRASDIFVYNNLTRAVTLISSTATNLSQTALYGAAEPVFALGGAAVLYTTAATLFSMSSDVLGSPDLHLRNLTGPPKHILVNATKTLPIVPQCCEAPAVSSDGALATFRSGYPNRKLHVKNMATGELAEIPGPHPTMTNLPPSQISNNGGRITIFRPDPAPGGGGLVFEVHDRPTGRWIAAVASDSGASASFFPNWFRLSSDGGHLFFTARPEAICCGSSNQSPAQLYYRDLDAPSPPMAEFLEAGKVSRTWPDLPDTGGVGGVAVAETPNGAAPFTLAWESTTSSADGELRTDIWWTRFPSESPPLSLRAALKATVDSATTPGNSALGPTPLDDGGKWVVFESNARLTSHPKSAFRQIYLRALNGGDPLLVSAGADGALGDGDSFLPIISPSGNAVAFFSWASNLASGVENTNAPNLFLFDRDLGRIELVNTALSEGGALVTGSIPLPPSLALSADASRIAFWAKTNSAAPYYDLLLRDRKIGLTTRMTPPFASQSSIPPRTSPQLTRDGRLLFWNSGSGYPSGFSGQSANSLHFIDTGRREYLDFTYAFPGFGSLSPFPRMPSFDATGTKMVYLAGPITPVVCFRSLDQIGPHTLGTNYAAAGISLDGRFAVMASKAPPAGPRLEFISLPDRARSQILLDSTMSNLLGRPLSFSMSTNGDWTTFVSGPNHAPSGDTNNMLDIFVAHRPTGTLRRLTAFQGLGASHPVISPDGSFILFNGLGDFGDDRNGAIDIFMAPIAGEAVDTDDDGLDDSWEFAHFNTLSTAPGDDADGDGMTNLQEFVAGTNPRDGSSILALQAVKSLTTGAVHLFWPAAPGVLYQVEFREALDDSPWRPLGPSAAYPTSAATLVDPNPSSPSRFYRARVAR